MTRGEPARRLLKTRFCKFWKNLLSLFNRRGSHLQLKNNLKAKIQNEMFSFTLALVYNLVNATSADKCVLISRDQLFSIDKFLPEVELFPKESWVSATAIHRFS